MLKDLEKLLTEIARQQGLETPPRRPPPPAAPARQPARRPAPRPAEPLDALVVEAEPVREDIRTHVARTVDTSDITQHMSQLGADVALSDDRLEARIHEKFDHDLGRINEDAYEQQPADQKDTSQGAAGQIAQMFRDPQTTRQAILLSEILTRPIDRW